MDPSNFTLDTYEIPEQAMCAFERLTGTVVVVHDLKGNLWPFLSTNRFKHCDPRCAAVKSLDGNAACGGFEIHRLRAELPDFPHGRVHICFARFVEWVVPVFHGGDLAWVFFAGIRTPGPGLTHAVYDSGPPLRIKPWARGTVMPDPVDDAEAAAILENLRQLAARLAAWAEEIRAIGKETARWKPKHEFSNAVARRRNLIRRFIVATHQREVSLGELARRLKLSESRAAHVVRECCGRPFKALLVEARLRTAAGLLRHAEMPVLNVGRASGFRDASHFHRAFRKRFGVSPLQYRKGLEP